MNLQWNFVSVVLSKEIKDNANIYMTFLLFIFYLPCCDNWTTAAGNCVETATGVAPTAEILISAPWGKPASVPAVIVLPVCNAVEVDALPVLVVEEATEKLRLRANPVSSVADDSWDCVFCNITIMNEIFFNKIYKKKNRKYFLHKFN